MRPLTSEAELRFGMVVTTLPAPCMTSVAPAPRVNVPVLSVSVRPVPMFQSCPTAPLIVSPDWIVRFCVASLMSILVPAAPASSVRVLPGPIVMAPPGSAMRMPCQLTFAPRREVLSPVTALVHTAMWSRPGTPPVQLPARFRLIVLLTLIRSAPYVDTAAQTQKKDMATVARETPGEEGFLMSRNR